MASNVFQDIRPDPAHWTRVNAGVASPLWFPFLMAAGAGAAWWTYANWARLAATSWAEAVQRQGAAAANPEGEGAPPEPAEEAQTALAENLAVQGEAPPVAAPAETPEVEDDGADAIDAAYAANLGPVPPPADDPVAKKRPAKKRKS